MPTYSHYDQTQDGCSDADPTITYNSNDLDLQPDNPLGIPIPTTPRYPRRVKIKDFTPGRLNTCKWSTGIVQKNEHTNEFRLVMLTCKRWNCAPCAHDKIHDLATWIKIAAPNKLLTLTLDPKHDDNAELAWIRSSPLVPELIRSLRKRFGAIEYLRVCEMTKNGWPHYHLMVRSDYLPQKVISSEWDRLTGSKIVDIRVVKDFFNSIRYLTKYLTKLRRIDWTDRHVTYSRHFFPVAIAQPVKDPEWRTVQLVPDNAHEYLDEEFREQTLTQLGPYIYALPYDPGVYIPKKDKPKKQPVVSQNHWDF